MAVRQASATWNGNLREGNGSFKISSHEAPYNFISRFESGNDTNPEELLGAAHAACFSMQMGATLERAGFVANRISTTANVHLEKGDAGFAITKIVLDTEGDVPGLDEAKFQEIAEQTKSGCIISRALSAVPMEVNAKLVS